MPASFEVTTLANSGAGSLRDAIVAGNANADFSNTITFNGALNGDIDLTSQLDALVKDYTITGPGDRSIKLHASGADATNQFRLLKINSGTSSSIDGLEIYGGYSSGSGGAILNEGTLSLTNDYIRNNHSGVSGGAISNAGTLTVAACELFYNDATVGGGAIATTGDCWICCGSEIWRNVAVEFGGEIIVSGSSASATVEDASQIYRNESALGGGVYVSAGRFCMTGGSIYENSSTSDGGGIYVRGGGGYASLSSMGLEDNTSGGVGGGFCVYEGCLFLDHSLLSGNSATGKASTDGGAWKDAMPGGSYAENDAVILDSIDSY